MPDGLDLSFLTDILGGGGAGAPATEGQPDQGFNYNALAAMLGQLAGAVAPGTVGAQLGKVGAQAGQANILAKQKEEQQKMLQQFLGGLDNLTGPGARTTGVDLDPKTGQLKISGTAGGEETVSPQTGATPATPVPPPIQDVSLQGGQTTSPFSRALRGL